MKSIEFISVNSNVKNTYFNSHRMYDKTDDDDDGFEGFEMCYDKLSERKRNLIYNNFLTGKSLEKSRHIISNTTMREIDNKAHVNKNVEIDNKDLVNKNVEIVNTALVNKALVNKNIEIDNKALVHKNIKIENESLVNKTISVYPLPKHEETTPFELIAQEFEKELECLPYIGWINENDELAKNQSTSSFRNRQKFYCYNCNQTFKTKKDLSSHLSDPLSCSSLCPICPYKGQDLKYHIQFHSETNADGMCICLLCSKTFTGDEFLNHLKEDHTY